jgi:hypothetical protein
MNDRQAVVYVDANPFIYAIEGTESLAVRLNGLFAVFGKQPGMAVTSELSLAEVLPKVPAPDRREAYLELITRSGVFDLKPITRTLLIETADYRRSSTVKLKDGRETMPRLPDAIHIVTAMQSGCRIVLSGDTRLRMPVGMRLVEANEAGVAALVKELA